MSLRWFAKALCLLLLAALLAIPAVDVAEAQSRGRDKDKDRSSNSRSGRKEQKQKPKGKASRSPSKKIVVKLNEAMELISAEKYSEARELLAYDLSRPDKLTDVDIAQVNRFFGFTYTSEDKYEEAIPYFETALKQKALDPQAQKDLEFQLAQLYMATEQFQQAVDSLSAFIAGSEEEPEPRAYYYLALAYTQTEDIDSALPHAKTAVDKSPTPNESWLRLLLNLYFQKEMYSDMLPVLELMIAEFPKKTYWMQLSAVYSELNDDHKAMAVQQLAFISGYLDADRDLVRLARMYLYNDIPYWAAKVVERGIKDEIIEPDAESWELLANSWITAREFNRAVEPLKQAAELAKTGDTFARLGQVYLEREQWDLAIEAINKALERGNLRDAGQAYLLLGICNFNAGRYQSAISSFRSAIKYDRVKNIAAQWIGHVQNTIAVNEAAKSSLKG